MLNATGGWTAIDEELNVASTNPVQNKTLYNLETFHTLNKNGRGFYIDDGLNIPEKTSVKLYFDRDLINNNTNGGLIIYQKNNPKYVLTTENGSLVIDYTNRTKIVGDGSRVLTAHNVLVGFNNENLPIYTKTFFKRGTVIEMLLISNSAEFRIVGDPIVGRYKYSYNYNSSPTWSITANAVVYASGLKIQWGNFTNHSADVDEETYFPVAFENTPSMSITFNKDANNKTYYCDMPCAISNKRWKLYNKAVDDTNYGTWIATGY